MGLWVGTWVLPWCSLSPVPRMWSQVPLRCAFSLVPRMCTGAPHTPERALGGWIERRLELLLQENSPNCCQVSLFFPLFLFEKFLLLNPAAPYKEGFVLSHSPPLPLDQGLSGSGPNTAQLSILPSWHTWSMWVYHFVLFPFL